MTDDALAAACARWTLRAPVQVADTATSRLYRVRHGDRDAALKLLKPYGADEAQGAPLLRWWDGAGAVRLVAAEGAAMLLEWAGGPPLGDMARAGGDLAAAEVLAGVLAQLHAPRAGMPALRPLERQLAALLEADPSAWPAEVGRAQGLARQLLAEAPVAALHGDFHHDNVLGSDRGWLAIDPKGLAGDPAYDLANVFRNPLGAPELALHPGRIAALADLFASRLGYDRARILGWAAVHAALSAVWNRADGRDEGFDLALLPRLLAA